eukprot:TRINITY_DN14723_c0_g1_i1.p1 TRINITY_DN14723_c0_g1~~TRINITY_DN14723_c0_g1_i1.p1  ORF type:complete len:392 (-),score=121.29 TRINITY_DN14723_c0_g1_i1:697-1872(-)
MQSAAANRALALLVCAYMWLPPAKGFAARVALAGGRPLTRATSLKMVLPLHEQAMKVVSVRSDAEGTVNVPWRDLGDMVFELLGGDCVTVREQGLTVYTAGRSDVGPCVRLACDLLELHGDVYANLDWEEDPVESYENWLATDKPGFPTIRTRRARVAVLPVQRAEAPRAAVELQIRLLEGDGWGNGEHPTTRMCLDFLEGAVTPGDTVVDYGTGSGVLSIAALALGARAAVGVDIDDEVLAHARQNLLLNGCLAAPAPADSADTTVAGRAAPLPDGATLTHTRFVQPGSLPPADIVVANILVGPLRRLAPVLALAVRDGGLLCLSGFRESDRDVLRQEYAPYVEWDDALSDSGEHAVWGRWGLLAGRPRAGLRDALRGQIESALSDLAVA